MMNEFWRTHFDKLLLSFLFLGGLFTHLYFARNAEFYSNPQNAEHFMDTIRWLQEIDGQILAALLTLMVGRSLTASATATPQGGAHAEAGPPPTPPPEHP